MNIMNQGEWAVMGWLCLQDDNRRGKKIREARRAERKAARAARYARQGNNRTKRDPMPRGKGRVDHDKSHIADQAS